MAKHAVYSPSSADRWMSCAGSIALSDGIPNPSSQYADEGTAAHFLGATCLVEKADACVFLGYVIELRQAADGEHFEDFALNEPEGKLLNSFTVDEDMADYVQVYLDYVRDLVKSTGGTLFVEVQVPIDHLTGEEDATGTSDAIIVADTEVIEVDLKYGRGVEVSAIENKQMRMYGSGAYRYVDDLVGLPKVERVRMAICQPRVTSLPSEWSCTLEELRAFEAEVKTSADRAHAIRQGWVAPTYCASEKACRFCRAKARCPELAKEVLQAVGIEGFSKLTATPPITADDSLPVKMGAVDLVEIWCKAVRAEVETQLLAGNTVKGYKLVQGRKGNRSWVDEALAERTLKKLKLKKDEMYEMKLISPTTAAKLIGEKTPAWEENMAKIITQKEGGLSVAPESDKRPAVEVKPMTDGFEPLDSDS